MAADVRTTTTAVLPGQPVEVTLRLRNASTATLSIHQPSELTGNVHTSVAQPSEPGLYREYVGPGWGLDCSHGGGSSVQLAKNAVVTLPLKLLHHAARYPDPETSVLTPFVFSNSGTYSLRVDFLDEGSCPDPGVSALATVQVLVPQGDDLAVWNEIKDCFFCAQLLHTQQFNVKRAVERAALDKLRDLGKRYPRSKYAPLIRQTIDLIDGKGKERGKEKDHKDGD